jgi:hypothetical protein
MPRGVTTGIIYIPLDVLWPRSKKVRAMIVRHGEHGFAAWGLYLAMACYCRENLTDGLVPADEIGALAYPLPADDAARLVALLLDYRLLANGTSDSTSHSTSDDTSHSTSHSTSYVVRAYVKRNGTRVETLELAARKSAGGKSGALSRWSGDPDADRMGTAMASAMASPVPDIDRDRDKLSRPRGRAPARDDWSPSGVLDRQAARRPVHKPSAQVLADARRPGGPTADATARADDARKALANRTRPLDAETDDTTDPTGTGLHGEQLARAQLAEIERRRAVERATAIGPAGTTDDDSESPDHGQPEDWPDDEPIVLPEHDDDDEQADRTDDGDPLPDDVPF